MIELVISFLLGAVLGIVGMIAYIKHKAKKKKQQLAEELGGLAGGMMDE